ncbi:uncharacterized protein PHALS_10371 [Plasmopara halstedii]|uniref:Uncharacterized protein n=1 Tax=Plasmopara halstedii TaxID=4781 RepID=A0A0P1AH78_PLAHL|nr:uncharacterized protein PHALS_10371 [Plasmopara halstedii]CEG40158.1 hypothetical protein PHALS_10371 [Plasmopara halstedii]|eukprot:XP_024576527.1 hypothetical protein PHALS_10371 [Plasmopara halstedii]
MCRVGIRTLDHLLRGQRDALDEILSSVGFKWTIPNARKPRLHEETISGHRKAAYVECLAKKERRWEIFSKGD